MKKFFIVFIAILTALSLSACLFGKPQQGGSSPGFSSNDDDEEEPEDDEEPSEKPEDEDEEPSEKPEDDEDEDDDSDVTTPQAAEGMVFLEDSGIRISAPSLELTDEYWGPELKILVENETDQDITAQIRYAAVNGIMVTTMFYCEVQAGKKANEVLTFSIDSLNISGIEKIAEAELIFEVYDTETWETLLTSEPVFLTVPENASYDQKIDDSGEVVVDEGDYKIVVQELDTENTYYGADLYVYIENNTDQTISVSADNVSVNGFMVYASFYCDLLPGTKAFTPITFFEEDLTENNITDISEIELIFYVYDYESWETLYESNPIHLAF